jgi:hypothetical protein
MALVEHLESKEYLDDLLSRYSLELKSHLGLLNVIRGEEKWELGDMPDYHAQIT